MAYMPSALLLDGLLEDCLALPSFNHVFHLLLSRPLPRYNESAPFYNFSAECMPHMLTWQMLFIWPKKQNTKYDY